MSLFAHRVYSKVERRRRAAARLALYSSLGLVALAGWGGARLVESPTVRAREQAWRRIDFAALPEVQLLSRYVQIDTSPTTGSEIEGARFLAAQLRGAGIASTIDIVDDRHANLWAIVEGENPAAIVLHSHIDVSPADPAEWDFPPFDGKIAPPWIRGRGTFDMKSIAIAQLMSVLDLARSAHKPKRSVILLATSGEEQGSTTGIQRILAQQPELVKRFAVMLTEGGAVEARSLEDIKYWGIEFCQRRFVQIVARAPTRERLDELRQATETAGRLASKPRVGREAQAFLTAYAGSRDRSDFQRDFAEPQRLVEDAAAFAAAPDVARELLLDEVFFGPVSPRNTPNEPHDAGFEMPISFLLLPDSPWDAARDRMLPPGATAGVTFSGGPIHGPAPGSPLDHPAYEAMRDTLHREYPSAPVGPSMIGHTLTDARFLRARGIPAYGFSPFLIFSIDTYRADKLNERLGLPGYVSGVALYRKLVLRLANDASPWK